MEDIALSLSLDEIVQELDDKNLLYMTTSKIKEIKNNVLQKMYLSREELKKYHKSLSDYIYVDELDEIKLGSFIRWFNISKIENLKLTNGGFVIDYKQGKDDINIICKNINNRVFTLCMNKCIIFKKLSNQEKILIKIIDFVHK
jgi:hypothetical protein